VDNSIKILSDLTVYSKYAKYRSDLGRRETWNEIVDRIENMHLKKYKDLNSEFKNEIKEAFNFVRDKKVLPSMRSCQFAGRAVELNHARQYNCSYLPIDSWEAFHEVMFLLMCGCGVGYSVQFHHVQKLPTLLGPSKRTRKFLIEDSIIGWSDAVKVLMKAYFFNKPMPKFDFSDIRPAGTPLKTAGGIAPGAQPLKDALHNVKKVLDLAISERGFGCSIKPIEVHDICCHLADAVLSGGIRRSALISLFSFNDHEMMECKFGNWWELNPQRGRANNSVFMLRHRIKNKDFKFLWDRVRASGSGEPGLYLSNDKDAGTNPCAEISLRPMGFCNLTSINVSDIDSQEELNKRVKAATLIGTIQASYTDFHYLRPEWQENAENEALLGVSMTGIASGKILEFDIKESSKLSIEENERVANIININPAKRIGTIKPEGSGSLVLGTSSGIHSWHSPYYVRRMRFGKDEAIYNYLKKAIPNLVEDDFHKPYTQGVVSIPIKVNSDSAIFRTERSLDLLERVKRFHKDWISPSHVSGHNTHNVSCTVNLKDDEWDEVGEWMWNNRDFYNGISVLPHDGGTYVQAPFEEIDESKYNELSKFARKIDLTKVSEDKDNTDLKGEVACGGGACEII